MKRVFLSYPMNGKTTEEQNATEEALMEKALKILGENFIPVTNRYYTPPEGAGRLNCLGEAIKKLDNVDAIIFDPEWVTAKGCMVENLAAKLYGVEILNETEGLLE